VTIPPVEAVVLGPLLTIVQFHAPPCPVAPFSEKLVKWVTSRKLLASGVVVVGPPARRPPRSSPPGTGGHPSSRSAH
jgi:hypothetical protein